MASELSNGIPVFTRAARSFHWSTVLLLAIQVPIGLYMTYRAYEMPAVNDKGEPVKGLFDGLTGTLYDSHKTIGIVLLALVLGRLVYRLTRGAPRPDPSVPAAMIGISHAVHWSIYLLLLCVPILGYIGISYYGATDVFGVPLPPVTAKDEKFSEVIFGWHETAAFVLLGLVAVHIGAAIYHRAVRTDRVVERMLPKSTA